MKILLFTLFVLLFTTASTQICYTYDHAGNRTQRTATCSGGGMTEMMRVTDTTSTAADTMQNLTASIYPNPTVGQVNIVLSSPVTTAEITVADNSGRQLYNATTGGSSMPINLANFAQGVYYITVRTGGSTFESTVVKN